MIAVKDAHSKEILSRASLRLLWDDLEDEPALYLDHIYSRFVKCPSAHSAAIIRQAHKRASSLGLKLYQAFSEDSTSYELSSLGSPVPFEYVDAPGIGITNGKFKVVSL